MPYYLDESNGWGLDAEELKRQLATAKADGIAVRGLAVINPGNPTGQTLSEENMKAIVQLCVDEDLVLMADEVYQENIWKSELPFTSFRKVATDMGYSAEYNQGQKGLALVSFHSISKGFIGECGIRGGYFELFGIDPQVKAQIYKLASISLCSNTPGQVMTGLMVQPPKLGDPSFEEYEAERVSVLSSLKRRAEIVAKVRRNSWNNPRCPIVFSHLPFRGAHFNVSLHPPPYYAGLGFAGGCFVSHERRSSLCVSLHRFTSKIHRRERT